MLKPCKVCGIEKEATSEFFVLTRPAGGLRSTCKACASAKSLQYYYKNHKERLEIAEAKRREKGIKPKEEYVAELRAAITPEVIEERLARRREHQRRVRGYLPREEFLIELHKKNAERHATRRAIKTEVKSIRAEIRALMLELTADRRLFKKREAAKLSQRKRREAGLKRLEKAERRSQEANCPWADKSKTKQFYLEARKLTRETGIQHSVDHIHPLKHPLVCGLHNEFNLQVLTMADNVRKNNHFVPYIESEL